MEPELSYDQLRAAYEDQGKRLKEQEKLLQDYNPSKVTLTQIINNELNKYNPEGGIIEPIAFLSVLLAKTTVYDLKSFAITIENNLLWQNAPQERREQVLRRLIKDYAKDLYIRKESIKSENASPPANPL
jgi:hypothetical protein